MMQRSLLVVDDEPDMLQLLKRSLEPDLGCKVDTATSGELAIKAMEQKLFDLVLADIKMPGMDGLELLALIKRNIPGQTVVMMTAHGDIETAVAALKNGAYDFITKPFDHDALVIRLEKALERSSLLRENHRLRQVCEETHVFEDMVGNSKPMLHVFETIRMVAKTDLTVLITGESGTGKELAARAIHSLSPRKNRPFVPVNCPTLPEQILESELFGYKKGAFTDATQNKIGLFQEAHGGTLFLDEIGDIGPAVQAKLLRVLQEKEIKPLGDTRSISVDVRILSSTNQDLKDKIQKGLFREDLFYRLNVLPLKLPPLAERRSDIPLIANHFLEKHCTKLGKPLKTISPELMAQLSDREWEGNIREMENIIIRGILFSRTDEIEPRDAGFEENVERPPSLFDTPFSPSYRDAKEENLKSFNTRYIGRLLTQNDGNVTQAAQMCGLERQALQQIMRRYGIESKQYRK
jgi:DNA-binding NtrC family response regulator